MAFEKICSKKQTGVTIMKTKEVLAIEDIDFFLDEMGMRKINKDKLKYGKELYRMFEHYANLTGARTVKGVYEQMLLRTAPIQIPFFLTAEAGDEENIYINVAIYDHPKTSIRREDYKDETDVDLLVMKVAMDCHKVFIDQGLIIPDSRLSSKAPPCNVIAFDSEYSLRMVLHNTNVRDICEEMVMH